MNQGLYGIIFKVCYESVGDTSQVSILGKKCSEWVAVSLDNAPYKCISYDQNVEIPTQVRPYLNDEYPYTAVLFSDTPLMSKKTIADAVATMRAKRLNVLKMTRGYIFSTAFLASADKLYSTDTYYFGEEDFLTVYSNKQVALVADALRLRIIDYHCERGVKFEDISSVRIDADVKISSDVTVGPNNLLLGKSIIKSGAKLLYNNVIEDSIIDANAQINSSRIYGSYVGERTTVGPFAYIRPESVISEDCRIGDFVEIKKSIIGKGSKVSHLSYVGDAEIGENCNVGCGVVFVNYDGKDKFRTKVGNKVFIGSNSNIIAPVVLSDGSFIAAGSTINGDVPQKALAIARARQVNKLGWKNNKYAKDDCAKDE